MAAVVYPVSPAHSIGKVAGEDKSPQAAVTPTTPHTKPIIHFFMIVS